MASTYLTRTPASTTNTTTWTWSGWVKLNKIGQAWFFGAYSSASLNTKIYLDGSNNLNVHLENGTAYRAQTDAVLRDFSAWYHIVVAVDTTQATASNRIKVYINGTQQSLTAEGGGYPPQNYSGIVNNSSYEHNMGYDPESGDYFQGLMSHVHFTDGTAYDASAFGQADANGVWTIKTSPSVTYGTNGFFILKDGNSVTDQSGNSNNWTVAGGTLTNTEDNPSNVFATFNALTSWRGQNITPSQVLANGNLKTGIGTTEATLLASTIGVKSGKWYWEAKSDGVSKMFFGICNTGAFEETNAPQDHSDGATSTGIYYYEGTPDFRYYSGATSTTGVSSISTGDVLGFAMDCDNSYLWIHKNGVYMNSGDPTSGASGTGAINSLFNFSGYLFYRNGVKTEMFPSCYVSSSTGSGTASFNFGNGYFGTTAVASAGTNASGIGIFEYDVPTGYTALSTKGLNL